jgi:hypothetical protein
MLVVSVAVFAARWQRNWARLKALKLGREANAPWPNIWTRG